MREFLELDLPKRQPLLGTWKKERDLSMMTGQRGVGKTLAALWLAHAVATGGRFLRWEAGEPRRVVYVDGEMQADAMQDRLERIAAGLPTADELIMISADVQHRPIPSLHGRKGQGLVEEHLEGTAFLILDNISALFGGEENDSAAWQAANDWLLALRRRGVAVLMLHHTGKSGSQRGTSRREDPLDNSILLSMPDDYRDRDGCRFVWRFTKHRHIPGGPEVEAFEAQLTNTTCGSQEWVFRPIESAERLIRRAIEAGCESVREIAAESGIPRSTVHRHLRRIPRSANGAPAPARPLADEGELPSRCPAP
jgi:putative DNA primase/helicase